MNNSIANNKMENFRILKSNMKIQYNIKSLAFKKQNKLMINKSLNKKK